MFVDESGANLAMGRSHAWVKRGQVLVEPRPMNWGDNLTMIGAIRADRWLTLSTGWEPANAERFVRWVERRLVPRLRRGDVVVMDNGGLTKTPACASSLRKPARRWRFCHRTRMTSIPLNPRGL